MNKTSSTFSPLPATPIHTLAHNNMSNWDTYIVNKTMSLNASFSTGNTSDWIIICRTLKKIKLAKLYSPSSRTTCYLLPTFWDVPQILCTNMIDTIIYIDEKVCSPKTVCLQKMISPFWVYLRLTRMLVHFLSCTFLWLAPVNSQT